LRSITARGAHRGARSPFGLKIALTMTNTINAVHAAPETQPRRVHGCYGDMRFSPRAKLRSWRRYRRAVNRLHAKPPGRRDGREE